MSVRIQELEDLLSQAQTRASNLEKAKNRLTQELREVTIELENVGILFWPSWLEDHSILIDRIL